MKVYDYHSGKELEGPLVKGDNGCWRDDWFCAGRSLCGYTLTGRDDKGKPSGLRVMDASPEEWAIVLPMMVAQVNAWTGVRLDSSMERT